MSNNDMERVYAQLAALGADVGRIKSFNPTFQQVKGLLDGLKKIRELKDGEWAL